MARGIKIIGGRYIRRYRPVEGHAGLSGFIANEAERDRLYRTQHVDRSSASRISNIVDESVTGNIRAVVIGEGGIGGPLTYEIAPFCSEIVGIDNDKVGAPNVRGARTPFGEKDIGRYKVYVIGDQIRERNPNLRYIPFCKRFQDFSDDEIIHLAQTHDVFIYAVDGLQALFKGDALTHSHTLNIFPSGHRGVRSGHIAISRPGGTCLRHILGVESEQEMHTLHAEPGLGIDFKAITLWTVRIILALFSSEQYEISLTFNKRHNFIFISNRLTSDEQTRSIYREKHSTCELCNS